MRIQLVHRVLVAVDGVDLHHHVGADAGQRMILDDPQPRADHRHAVLVRADARLGGLRLALGVIDLEHRVEPVGQL